MQCSAQWPVKCEDLQTTQCTVKCEDLQTTVHSGQWNVKIYRPHSAQWPVKCDDLQTTQCTVASEMWGSTDHTVHSGQWNVTIYRPHTAQMAVLKCQLQDSKNDENSRDKTCLTSSRAWMIPPNSESRFKSNI